MGRLLAFDRGWSFVGREGGGREEGDTLASRFSVGSSCCPVRVYLLLRSKRCVNRLCVAAWYNSCRLFRTARGPPCPLPCASHTHRCLLHHEDAGYDDRRYNVFGGAVVLADGALQHSVTARLGCNPIAFFSMVYTSYYRCCVCLTSSNIYCSTSPCSSGEVLTYLKNYFFKNKCGARHDGALRK